MGLAAMRAAISTRRPRWVKTAMAMDAQMDGHDGRPRAKRARLVRGHEKDAGRCLASGEGQELRPCERG